MATPDLPDADATDAAERRARPPAGPTRVSRTARDSGFDRRALLLSGALLALAILGGIVAVTLTSDAGDRPEQRLAEGEIPPASAIPQPGRGRPPENAGERGGWEQIGLFGLLFASMGGIGVVIFRGGRRARANRARWVAAGATGRDGALDHRGDPTDDDPVGTATGTGGAASPRGP